MEYICPNPSSFSGKAIGTGQCVALVQVACKAPLTHKPDGSPQWRAGRRVQGDLTIPGGTAIAAFDADGSYGNHTNGTSHAAIYIGQTAEGLYVWDQWLNQPTHQRIIHFRAPGDGDNVNNGIAFSVIETTPVQTTPNPGILGSGATGEKAAADFIAVNKPSSV